MAQTFTGRVGHYWDKSSCIISSRGEYMLDETYPCEFGEPVCLFGTGLTGAGPIGDPIKQRTIKSYDAAAGAERSIGVFIDWRTATSTLTDFQLALTGAYNKNREPTVVKRGPVSIRNVGSGAIEDGQRTIPANGGCELMTASGQYSLGKAMQRIEPGSYGIVYVNPDEEKAIIA